MTDRVSKIWFMGFGSSIQNFYEFFGMFDDISKAEQEIFLKKPWKTNHQIFLNLTFTPIFWAVSGYSIHHH